ncbi:MAG: hypothetical protein ACETV0_06075 [Nitrososphaeria archaeon]
MARPIAYVFVRSPAATWKGLGREGQRKLEPGMPNVVVVYYAIAGSSRQTILTWLARTTRRNCTLQPSPSPNHRNELRRGRVLLVLDSSASRDLSRDWEAASFMEFVLP